MKDEVFYDMKHTKLLSPRGLHNSDGVSVGFSLNHIFGILLQEQLSVQLKPQHYGGWDFCYDILKDSYISVLCSSDFSFLPSSEFLLDEDGNTPIVWHYVVLLSQDVSFAIHAYISVNMLEASLCSIHKIHGRVSAFQSLHFIVKFGFLNFMLSLRSGCC